MSSTSSAEEKSQNLLDPNSSGFYIPVIAVMIVLFILITIGTIWDYYIARKKSKFEATQGNIISILFLFG